MSAYPIMVTQIVQLFPTEDPQELFIKPYQNELKQSVGAKGTLYNHYKVVRKDLRSAKFIIINDDEDVSTKPPPFVNAGKKIK